MAMRVAGTAAVGPSLTAQAMQGGVVSVSGHKEHGRVTGGDCGGTGWLPRLDLVALGLDLWVRRHGASGRTMGDEHSGGGYELGSHVGVLLCRVRWFYSSIWWSPWWSALLGHVWASSGQACGGGGGSGLGHREWR